jgi:murein endopeptidase
MLRGLRGESAGASTQAAPTGPTPFQNARALPGSDLDAAGQLRQWPPIAWDSSRAVGRPYAGRLERGVHLPREGKHFFTWDLILKRFPNRGWRRWGTDDLVRRLLRVLAQYRAANPQAPRVGIADLSRPHGGEFGPRFGGLGHKSHQNGLDVDIIYPRFDRLERQPVRAGQIDRALAQDLVDRFVRAGAVCVYVGPRTHLRGHRRTVQPLVHHDDHMHVRIGPR